MELCKYGHECSRDRISILALIEDIGIAKENLIARTCYTRAVFIEDKTID